MTKFLNVDIQETLKALECCTNPIYGCEDCPFAKYKNTCRSDLMIAAQQAITQQLYYIDKLEHMVGDLSTDREVWLSQITALEKEAGNC